MKVKYPYIACRKCIWSHYDATFCSIFLKTSIFLLIRDYQHSKFGLIWVKESRVTEGEGEGRNPSLLPGWECIKSPRWDRVKGKCFWIERYEQKNLMLIIAVESRMKTLQNWSKVRLSSSIPKKLFNKKNTFRERKEINQSLSDIIAWLKFLYGLLSIFPLILFVYGTQSPFSICPYKTFLVLDRNNGPW